MGCGESKQPRNGAAPAKASGNNANNARYPLLDTPEEQAARFLQLCHQPSEQKPKHGSHARRSHATTHLNPLAVELERVYHDTRVRVFEQQKEDGEAIAAKAQQEQHERVQGRHFNQVRADAPAGTGPTADAADSSSPPPPPPDAAATATDGAAADTHDDAVLPPALQQPAQKDFTLFVNDSIEQARLRNFTAFDVVEAVELFVGYVKNDLRQQQEQAQRGNASQPGSRRSSLEPKTAPTPSVPWTCRMQCTLSGDSPQAEQLLDDARRRWREEREASHLQSGAAGHHTSKRVMPASHPSGKASGGGNGAAAAPATSEPLQEQSTATGDASAKGGKGLLLIDAVFESALPGSFDRRTPWQLEIMVHFAA